MKNRPRGMRLWHQRDSRDACNAVIAAGMIAFRLGGFAWTPAHESHQPNFLQRRESLSTVFSAGLMRHRMSPAAPHRDIDQTSINTTQRLRASPSLQARFAFPALTSVAQGFPDRLTDISATDICSWSPLSLLACLRFPSHGQAARRPGPACVLLPVPVMPERVPTMRSCNPKGIRIYIRI